MATTDDKPRCRGTNKAGEPCGCPPRKGTDYCSAHSPVSPGSARFGSPEQAAPRRRPKRPGRPSDFTPQAEQMILEAVRAGASLKSAAGHAGVSDRTLQRWKAAGEEEDAPADLRVFSDALVQARAQGRVALAASIRRAANEGDWRAAAWMLERLEPEA